MEKLTFTNRLNTKKYLSIRITILLIVYAGKFVVNDALPYYGFEK